MSDKHVNGWIGFDLDGTLAEYHGWGDGSVGVPIERMVNIVKQFMADGYTCKIVTARVSTREGQELQQQKDYIEQWCIEVFEHPLEVTHQKDFHMYCLFDDRAVAVEKNTGKILGHCPSLGLFQNKE